MSELFRCPGCRRYSTYAQGELTGVIYTAKRYLDSPDEHDNRCDNCGYPEPDFDEIPREAIERLQRKLSENDLAGYLNEQH